MIDTGVTAILDRSLSGEQITPSEAHELMGYAPGTPEVYAMMWAANKLTREMTGGQAVVSVQIGLDHGPCPENCKFCSLSAEAALFEPSELSLDEVVGLARGAVAEGASGVGLMATAALDFDRYIRLAEAVVEAVGEETRVGANIADFGPAEARRLKSVGIAGVYHAVRLREGVDTGITPERRQATISAARDAGLPVGYWVDPVGPEHTADEIIAAMYDAKAVAPHGGGVCERVPVPGSAIGDGSGRLSRQELARLVAITRLVVGRDGNSVGHHEPNILCMCAGASNVCVEIGANPRDRAVDSSRGRGITVAKAREMLESCGYTIARRQWGCGCGEDVTGCG